MAEANRPGTDRPLVSRVKIDLTDEAHRLVRQRIRVVATGVVLGFVFMGVGGYEVGLLYAGGPSVDYAIALLLIVLGGAVAYVSLRSGLINPVTEIRGNAQGITFERRWGRPLTWEWKDARFRLDIDDRSVDPSAVEDARGRLFFEGPSNIYGNLTPASLDPLLDIARTFGDVVTSKQLEQRDRAGIHLVRRIRVGPPPSH